MQWLSALEPTVPHSRINAVFCPNGGDIWESTELPAHVVGEFGYATPVARREGRGETGTAIGVAIDEREGTCASELQDVGALRVFQFEVIRALRNPTLGWNE